MWGWVTLSQGGVGASASARTSASASTSRLAPVHCREVLGFKGVSIALGFKGETCYQRIRHGDGDGGFVGHGDGFNISTDWKSSHVG